MQKALSAHGIAAGDMEISEGALREIQNAFTFGVDHHVSSADLANIFTLENILLEKFLFSDLSLEGPGNSEAFKNFLARNRVGGGVYAWNTAGVQKP